MSPTMSQRAKRMFGVVGAVLLSLPGPAAAFGPGVHMREADRWAAQHAGFIAPADLPYLHLGAFFPDIRSAGVSLPINTHNPAIGDALLALAEADGASWKRAFALGYRLHTASDTSAQVIFIPWLTAQTGLQAVNLFGLPDLPPVADNELLIEGWGDLQLGDLSVFLDLVYAFMIDKSYDIAPVKAFFLAGLAEVLGDTFDPPAVLAQLDAFEAKIGDTLSGFDAASLQAVLAAAKEGTLAQFAALLSSGLLGDVLGQSPGAEGLTIDPIELERLMAHPIGATPYAYFSEPYEAHFQDLGPAILDDPGYDSWSWYRGTTISAAVLQSLALVNPTLSHRPAVLLYDVGFSGPGGGPVSMIDAAAPPDSLTAHCELFLAFGDPVEVTFRVVSNPPGLPGFPSEASEELPPEDPAPGDSIPEDSIPEDSIPEDSIPDAPLLQGPVLAETTAWVGVGPTRVSLALPFDPAVGLGTAASYGLQWQVEGDPHPYLVSDFDRYALYSQADLFAAPYAHASGAAAFLPEVRIAYSEPLSPTGSLRGTITAAGRVGLPATLRIDAGAPLQTGPNGVFAAANLAPGSHTASAHAPGFADAELSLGIVADQTAVASLALEPVPLPAWSDSCCAWSDGRRWTAGDAPIPVTAALDHFPIPPTALTWAVAPKGDLPTAWAAPETLALSVPTDLSDGDAVVAWARADGGTPASSGPLYVDRSPPVATLRVTPGDCEGPIGLEILGSDDQAPIVATQWRLAGHAWKAQLTPTVSPPTSPRPWRFEGRVQNAAGLYSPAVAQEICLPAPAHAEPAAYPLDDDLESETSPDASSPGQTDTPPTSPLADSGGCRAASRSAHLGSLWALLLLIALLYCGVRRYPNRRSAPRSKTGSPIPPRRASERQLAALRS